MLFKLNKISIIFITICILCKFRLITTFTIQYIGNAQAETNSTNCYFEDLDLLVPLNTTIWPTNHQDYCVRVHCREDYVLEIKHCERIMLHSGCHMTSYDYTKPFPDCCYQVVCNEID